jgi:hypothetical protein
VKSPRLSAVALVATVLSRAAPYLALTLSDDERRAAKQRAAHRAQRELVVADLLRFDRKDPRSRRRHG